MKALKLFLLLNLYQINLYSVEIYNSHQSLIKEINSKYKQKLSDMFNKYKRNQYINEYQNIVDQLTIELDLYKLSNKEKEYIFSTFYQDFEEMVYNKAPVRSKSAITMDVLKLTLETDADAVSISHAHGMALKKLLCVCGKEGIFQCAKCKRIIYCSKECQTGDWKSHKPNCKKGS